MSKIKSFVAVVIFFLIAFALADSALPQKDTISVTGTITNAITGKTEAINEKIQLPARSSDKFQALGGSWQACHEVCSEQCDSASCYVTCEIVCVWRSPPGGDPRKPSKSSVNLSITID